MWEPTSLSQHGHSIHFSMLFMVTILSGEGWESGRGICPAADILAVSGDVLVLTTWGEGGGCFWRGESRDETVGANTLYSIWDSPWQCRISHPRTQIALRNLTRRTNKWVETKTTRTLKEIPFLHGRKQGKCMRSGQLNQGWLHAHSHAPCTSRGLDPSFL